MKRLAWIFCFFWLCGCGYSFQGTVNNLPRDIHRIAVPTVQNSTTRTELTTALTNELIRQFTLSKLLSVTNVDAADAVLEANIKAVRIESGALSRTGRQSLSRRVSVMVDAVLKRKDDGRVLWEAGNMIERRTYGVAQSQTTEESNLAAALNTVAVDLAEKIHNGIFESF